MYSLKQRFMTAVVFPLFHYLKRDGLLNAISKLEESQWLSSRELAEIQTKKLKMLLSHCENNVPYYSRLFKTAGLTAKELSQYELFKRLPVLTKQLINNNRASILAEGINTSHLVKSSTGGSTGEPLVFYNDKPSILQRQAVVYRNQKWVGALYSDREVRLWGAQIDLDKLTSWRSKLHSLLNSTIHLSTYDLSDESMRKYYLLINQFKPKLLISYPSPLAEFSKYIIDNNIKMHGIKSIITSAEKLFNWQRDLIKKAFHCEIFDRYGCREFGNIAHECDHHNGYHVNDERFFLEILDENGEPVKSGEIGKLFITDLDNYAFPFVRYEIGDMAVTSNQRCSCGRGLSLIEGIEGRSFDIIKCPNGNRVAGTFWTICLRSFTGVIKFQVEQTNLNQLIIRLIVDDKYSSNSENDMSIQIHEKCGNDMKIIFEYVDSIELSTSGKEKLVVCRLKGA